LLAVVFKRMVWAFRALPATLNTLNKDMVVSLICYWPTMASCICAILWLMNVKLAW